MNTKGILKSVGAAMGLLVVFTTAFVTRGDTFYVGNYVGNNVVKLDSNGTVIGALTDSVKGPQGLAVDGFGNLFVANHDNGTVIRFNPTGTASTFASSGLVTPTGAAFDSAGNLYVANYDGHTVTRFDVGGTPSTYANAGIDFPTGLAFDKTGNLYVASHTGNTVRKFSPTGVDLGNFATSGLNGPEGLAFDKEGNLYVANFGLFNTDYSISKFSPTGAYLGAFVTAGLDGPEGICFDSAGNLLVANHHGNTIRKYSASGADLGVFASAGLNGPAFILRAPPTSISGVITGTETWSGNVFLTGDVTVSATGSLTILPGTIIEADAGSDDQVSGKDLSRIEIIVESGGTFTAVGTEASPIRFTSSPVVPAAQAPADWYGIRLGSDQAQMKYCVIEWGDRGVSVEGFRQTLDHCVIESNRTAGIFLTADLELAHSTVRGNTFGIVEDSPTPFSQKLTDSIISDNGYGIQGGNLEAQSCTFIRNANMAIYLDDAVISDSVISANGTGAYAGNISIANSRVEDNIYNGITAFEQLLVDRCVVSRNKGDSGAVAIIAMGSCRVLNSSIIANIGTGIAFQYDGSCLLSNNVISENKIGFYTVNGTFPSIVATLTNNLIFSNEDFEIYSGSLGPIIADGNYFGEPTTSELRSGVRNLTRIHDTRDDSTVGQVVIHTWLESAAGVSFAPTIVQAPLAQTTYQGNNVTLSVLANGSGPLSYQWFKGVTQIPGATGPALTFNGVLVSDSGSYSVRVSNSAGTITTDPVTLAVNPASESPVLSLQIFAGIAIQGIVGKTYSIQFVTDPDRAGDWTAWTTLTTLVLPSTPFVFVDPGSGDKTKRFYRAVLQP